MKLMKPRIKNHVSMDNSIPIVYWVCVVFTAVFYLILAANTPYSILIWQGFDDALFINQAKSLAEGRWLGRFSETTLVKGPGYPIFLAINYWLGLPISLSHALFYTVSLGVLSQLVLKLSRSQPLAIFTFVLPLLDPRVIEDNRILRDAIYSGQSVLTIAVFAYSLFGTRKKNSQRMLAAIAGLLAGWFWLTREEGVWLIPSLLFILFFAWLHNKYKSTKLRIVEPAFIAISFAAIVQIAFGLGNLIAYNKFSGVDVGESNFRAALKAMESVRIGKQIPFVSVPRSVRNEIYKISPSFSQLEKFIDPDGSVSAFAAGGCLFRLTSCGDISSGFFMWALRDAASKAGHYQSPETASNYFKQIANDITKACESKRFACKQNSIPYLPEITFEQAESIPAALKAVWNSMVSSGPQRVSTAWKILGPQSNFETALSILNQPAHYPIIGKTADIEMQGWYYRKGQGDLWFNAEISDDFGENLPFSLVRVASPDLVQTFQDKLASRQRFRLNARCADNCKVVFSSPDSERFVVPVNTSKKYFSHNATTLAFDRVSAGNDIVSPKDVRLSAAMYVSALLHRAYDFWLPIVLIIGLFAFALSCYFVIRRFDYPLIWIVAGACWISIAARAVILVLVDISLFPAITVNYMQPIFTLSLVASVLSIGTLLYYLPRGQTSHIQELR
jgi:hypothetical protein